MGRIVILMMVGGGALAFFGFQEFRISSGSTTKPQDVSLVEIERGNRPTNNHLRLGPHYAVLGGAVYEYEADKYSQQETPSSKVNEAYYAVYSLESPFGRGMQALLKKYGPYSNWPEDIPEAEQVDLAGLSMVIKTKRFRTIGSIPEDIRELKSVTGMIINDIESMDKESKDLLSQSFGNQLENIDNLLIIEEGRTPTSSVLAMAMMGGGALLIIAPIVFLIRKNRTPAVVARPRSRPAAQDPTAPPPLPDDPANALARAAREAEQANNPYNRTD